MRYTFRKQQTIEKSATIEGFGYWSGADVTVEFRPAEPDTGIVFVRSDLDSPVSIPAVVENRIESPLRTTLSFGGSSVEMVEHLMAALAGLQIDNCEIWVNQPEIPGGDGSSLMAVEALLSAGIVEQDAIRPQMVIQEVTRVGDDESWIEARPSKGKSRMSVRYRLDYGSKSPIGRQTFETAITPKLFVEKLAPTRTFILKEEADWLLSQGLGKRVTYQDLLVFDELGVMENELRFEDECVRHKSLDLVGDLALAGCDLVGHFVAHCSGHRLNAELVQVLLTEGQVLDSWSCSVGQA